MNWKLFGTMVTLIGVGASVALGQGTTPTIVQGDYISNVFGNSNFIKNPNAKLNTKDVTFTGSQVARSATTPLVATSEFNLSLLQNANADWSTRSFDAGMKGQNCEARFTYRGFATATTTAQIVQNSLVVAQLVLTPSTDPRIASINFPCGDLSFGTTFRIAQTTAAMTGTNEIGGIYVGLATNMANVAQAEMIGTVKITDCSTDFAQSTNSTNFQNMSTVASCVLTPSGRASSTQTKDISIKFDSLPAGQYQVIINGFTYVDATATTCFYQIYEDTSTNNDGLNYVTTNTNTASTIQYLSGGTSMSGMFQFSGAASARTFRLRTRAATGNGANCRYAAKNVPGDSTSIAVYRFPSSSELVVKPETQNVFGGVKFSGTNLTSNNVTSAVWTELTQPGNTKTFYGRGTFDSSASENGLRLKIPNMPVGSYKVTISNVGIAQTAAASLRAVCNFRVTDGAGTVAAQTQSQGYSSSTVSNTYTPALGGSGIYVNTSVADRVFKLEARNDSPVLANTACLNYLDAGTLETTYQITPVDQPSNSALYVQGPVLSAGTGTASAAGYQGEEVSGTSTAGTGTNCAAITVNPGQWILHGMAFATLSAISGSVFYDIEIDDASGNLSASTGSFVRTIYNVNGDALLSTTRIVRTSVSKTYYLNCRVAGIAGGSAVKTNQTSVFKAVRLN